jgi:hypothetical protein
MIDRRSFFKLAGLTAAVSAVEAIAPRRRGPEGVSALALRTPGTYQITGRVRLTEPLVEISGIANAQQISWSGVGVGDRPVANFTTFEHFDQPWSMPAIRVRGGRLEALAVTPLLIAS